MGFHIVNSEDYYVYTMVSYDLLDAPGGTKHINSSKPSFALLRIVINQTDDPVHLAARIALKYPYYKFS